MIRRAWCRLFGHRLELVAHHEELDFVYDDQPVTAHYVLHECRRCGLFIEQAEWPAPEISIPGATASHRVTHGFMKLDDSLVWAN